MKITYLKGDATQPIDNGKNVTLCHICNNEYKWGAGFVLALSKRWKEPKIAYYTMPSLKLGDVSFAKVNDRITVANMIAQNGFVSEYNPIAVDYLALASTLSKANVQAIATGADIHAPMIGSGLGGGDWSTIEQIIKDNVTVDVYIYKL